MKGLFLYSWKNMGRSFVITVTSSGLLWGLGPSAGYTLNMSITMTAFMMGIFSSMIMYLLPGGLPFSRKTWALIPWIWLGLGALAGLLIAAPLGLTLQYFLRGSKSFFRNFHPLSAVGPLMSLMFLSLTIPGMQRWGFMGVLTLLFPLVILIPLGQLIFQVPLFVMVLLGVFCLAGGMTASLRIAKKRELGGTP